MRPYTLFLHEFTKKIYLLNRDFSLVHQYILIPVYTNVYIFIKKNQWSNFFYILSNTRKKIYVDVNLQGILITTIWHYLRSKISKHSCFINYNPIQVNIKIMKKHILSFIPINHSLVNISIISKLKYTPVSINAFQFQLI